MPSRRAERVSSLLQQRASQVISYELSDPRISKLVTVTRVEMSTDLKSAKVFVSILGDEKEQQLCLHGLKAATGHIQTRMVDGLDLRYAPKIRILADEGQKKANRVNELIRKIQEERPADQTEETPESSEETPDQSP